MPKLEESEIRKYWEIFSGLSPQDNKLSGEKVRQILSNSQLSSQELTHLWDLADIDSDGNLDFEEFCIAMRLVYDKVNNISGIPSVLPDWLIPASKAHLIQLNRLVQTGTNYTSDEDEDYSLSDSFDWYISPLDKSTYESIYQTSSDTYGRISFDSLNELYRTLNIPETDISSAWNLVNPKQSETIDKDQVLVYLHILNQRSNGKRVPRGVPPSLRATFNKETPDYNIDSHQLDIRRPTLNTKQSFADSYLNRITGQSSTQSTEKGTDFSATKGTDWEEVRLQRELKDLEELISKAESASKEKESEMGLAKYEFEHLLAFKERELSKLSQNVNLAGLTGDIEDIELQVKTLEKFLEDKNSELTSLKSQIQSI